MQVHYMPKTRDVILYTWYHYLFQLALHDRYTRERSKMGVQGILVKYVANLIRDITRTTIADVIQNYILIYVLLSVS